MTAVDRVFLPAAAASESGATNEASVPSRRARVAIALALGLVVAGYVIAREHFHAGWGADIDQSWAGARALLSGQDPYKVVGPGGSAMHSRYPLFYPLTALLLALPLATIPLAAARVVFEGASAAALAYAITRHGYARLAVFASAAFLTAIAAANWEPLLVAAALTPGAAFIYLAKPNEGLALACALTRRRAALVGVGIAFAVLALSIALWPGWVGEWRRALHGGTHFDAPILRPGGFLVLAALAKWRRAEARLLVALASVPQTLLLYAALPLFLVARSRIETLLLAFLSYIPLAVQLSAVGRTPFAVQTQRTGDAIALCLYLPCLIMVLRRPNAWATLDDALQSETPSVAS